MVTMVYHLLCLYSIYLLMFTYVPLLFPPPPPLSFITLTPHSSPSLITESLMVWKEFFGRSTFERRRDDDLKNISMSNFFDSSLI